MPHLHNHTSLTVKTHGITPKHQRGQNFLIDKNVLVKIIKAADLQQSDTVLEIGAGNGTLTKALATRVAQVVAVEIDRDLIPVLEMELADHPNVAIIKDDIMARPITDLIPESAPYKVVANIPYSITSSIIRKFLTERPHPSSLTLLIQKEVAQRIIARGGESSLLSLSVQYFATPKLLFTVSKNSFWPKPKVDSAVIQIALHPEAQIPTQTEQDWFFKCLHAGFSAKRKKLSSNLAQGLGLSSTEVLKVFSELKLSENARAQELGIEEWKRLSDELRRASK